MPRNTKIRAITAAGAAAVLLLTGCTHSSGKKPPPSDPPSTTSSTKPTSSAPPDPYAVASAAAMSTVKKYYAAIDASLQAGGTDPAYNAVMADDELTGYIRIFNTCKQQGCVQTGSVKITTLSPGPVSLTTDLKANPPQLPTVTVYVCTDSSQVKIVNSAGQPFGNPNAPKFLKGSLTVSNVYLKADGWRVTTGANQAVTSCAS